MKTLNTIIEEEKKKAKESALSISFRNYDGKELNYTYSEDDLTFILTTAMQRAYEAGRADWLSSEIKKLEGAEKMKSKIGFEEPGTKMQQIKQRVFAQGYNCAIHELITRYKEELKELEKVSPTKTDKQ